MTDVPGTTNESSEVRERVSLIEPGTSYSYCKVISQQQYCCIKCTARAQDARPRIYPHTYRKESWVRAGVRSFCSARLFQDGKVANSEHFRKYLVESLPKIYECSTSSTLIVVEKATNHDEKRSHPSANSAVLRTSTPSRIFVPKRVSSVQCPRHLIYQNKHDTWYLL